MKISKNILVFDLIVQSLIIGSALLTALSSLFIPFSLVMYMLCQLAMGFWQVLSALIIVLLTRDSKRLYYLAAVAAFFINGSLIGYFFNQIHFGESIIMMIFWIGIPMVFAGWYLKMTFKDLKQYEKSMEQTFETKDFV